MAARDDRRQQLLAALVLILAAVLVYRVWARPSPAAPAASNGRAAGAVARATQTPAKAPDVELDRLKAERPKPVAAERNPFRFKPKPAPPPPPPAERPAPGPERSSAPGVAQPPPIALKFIGIVEATEQGKKLAVLSDGRNVYQGREGDIIEGRYRILHIGAESIEMSYLDGRGRQTIRLTGS
ncbi:MAG: hypothetical protein ACM3SQ_19175 [Betaproteobacteria bacterium]